ncbi:MAG: cation diffusion facilitator family transporter [Gammaproteobacteria bacterium]
MHAPTQLDPLDDRYKSVRKVTLIGSVIDLVLGVAKVVIGWLANSQALIADGIHSFSDLLTDFLVLYAAKHSHKEADEDHPYGHGRIETLATVGLGVALIVIAIGIAYDSILRINDKGTVVSPGMLALVVAFISIVAKEGIYHYTVREARRLRSDLLMANAWHSRSDAISSIVVLIGIIGAMLGYKYLDAVAAVVVGVMIAKIGFDLVRSSSEELIDTALDAGEIKTIRSLIHDTGGVQAVHMLRSRKSAGDAFIDVHIQVDPRVSVSEGHQVSEAVRKRLIEQVDVVTDVTVHIDPEDDENCKPCDELPDRLAVMRYLKSTWTAIPDSHIEAATLHYLSGELQIDLILPLNLLADSDSPDIIKQQLLGAVADAAWISDIHISFA